MCTLQLHVLKCFVVCTDNANFACPCFACKASTLTGHSVMISVFCHLGLLYASVCVSNLNEAASDVPELRLLDVCSQLSLADSFKAIQMCYSSLVCTYCRKLALPQPLWLHSCNQVSFI